MGWANMVRIFALLCVVTPLLAHAAIPAWRGPLSTRGRWIVDADGNRFKLKSGNWHGASGTYSGSGDINVDSSHHSNENSHTLPLGLQYASLNAIIDSFESLGINSIRLPFSNEMIADGNKVQDAWVAANPDLRGLTPLQVYDRVIAALTARGFAVILNNHTNKSKWCCGANDGNDRWNKSQSDQKWEEDWLFMVRRYKDNVRVVGADLYNEVRRDILDDPNWGLGTVHDWYAASQRAGDRILLEANSNILIIIEGINWTGIPVDGLPHHRPTLEPIRQISTTLVASNKLVYAAHFYGYTGPNHSGATGIGETTDPRYRDFDRNGLFQVMTDQAGYVAFDTGKHYVAPLWISEFGVGRGVSDGDRTWFLNTVDFLIERDIDFAYWPLVGYLGPNNSNGWALMNWNPSNGQRDGLYDGNDWRRDTWNRLVTSGRTGNVPEVSKYSQLNIDYGDAVKSAVQRGRGDFDSGARKGMCPDGQRLLGISRSHRGLCTDITFGTSLWASGQPTQMVNSQQYVSGGDWAGGYTKYQCPQDFYVVGYAVRGTTVSSVQCARAGRSLGTSQYTRWFDQGDSLPSGNPGGDFSPNQSKGSCETNEYVAGIAFTTRLFSSPNAAAILCRK